MGVIGAAVVGDCVGCAVGCAVGRRVAGAAVGKGMGSDIGGFVGGFVFLVMYISNLISFSRAAIRRGWCIYLFRDGTKTKLQSTANNQNPNNSSMKSPSPSFTSYSLYLHPRLLGFPPFTHVPQQG